MSDASQASVIRVLDKEFEKYISAGQIAERVKELGRQMQQDISTLNPIFLAVLNGSFFFASDLLKEINFPYEISFIKVSSYLGVQSTGQTNSLLGLDESLHGRNIVVIEDIVDTGRTLNYLMGELRKMGTSSIRIATLILKPDALKYDIPLDYVGFQVPDDFIVGYGLDYDRQGRHYKDIYKLKSDN